MYECVSEKDALAFLIASFNGRFLGNEAAGALGGKVCYEMRNSVIWLALM